MCLTNTLRVRWVYSVIKLHSALWALKREKFTSSTTQASRGAKLKETVGTSGRTSGPQLRLTNRRNYDKNDIAAWRVGWRQIDSPAVLHISSSCVLCGKLRIADRPPQSTFTRAPPQTAIFVISTCSCAGLTHGA